MREYAFHIAGISRLELPDIGGHPIGINSVSGPGTEPNDI
jgi:hypothetical protein